MSKIKPKDCIALAVILAFLVLKLKGFDGMVDAGFMVILGYYFAKRVENKDSGQ